MLFRSDHSTPCNGKAIHSGESVAFMAKGPYVRRDFVSKFNEIDCSLGSINLKGSDFMNYILNAMDETMLYHLKQGKHKKNYRHTNFLRKL